ncbi:MAG: PHB depolymerase family esterase [Burkholderiaceae bacterium]|nr:PHB depolymerase family esterase [Burkholderiaceae bacterium]
MKLPFDVRGPAFDAGALRKTIRRALAAAGLDTGSGPLRGVADTVRRALAAGGLAERSGAPEAGEPVVDAKARVGGTGTDRTGAPLPGPATGDALRPGRFETHEFSNPAGARSYKLFLPARTAAAPPPVLVMLHGCTQSADDFAAGTRMNRLAGEQGFLVVYPEQPPSANPSKCWNWFNAQDQQRDAGEPSLIAGIVREVVARHGADPRRVFVAGLSAGAAMAVILGETYPELFAGVGAHSGLPYGSAHDLLSALAAMKGGRSGLPGLQGIQGQQADAAPARRKAVRAVPIIVFHGDRDHLVQATNGARIAQQAWEAHRAEAADAPLRASTHSGSSPGGRSYSRTVHADAGGEARIEFWTVHGAGHAWSGGSASGSFTDAAGPDASAEMLRFFLGLRRAGST